MQVSEDTSVDGVILAGNTARGQQLDSNAVVNGPAAAEPAAAVTPKKESGVSLDESDEDVVAAQDKTISQDTTESQSCRQGRRRRQGGCGNGSRGRRCPEAEGRRCRKLVRKNDSSNQPLLDEDDGSAYDASTL